MKEVKLVKSDRATWDDFEHAIVWNRRLLVPVGVWPSEKNDSRSERIAMIMRRVISGWIMFFYVIPETIYISSQPNISEQLPMMAPLTFQLLAIIKFVVLMLNGEKIDYCVRCMREDWERIRLKEDQEAMIESANYARYMTVCCFGCMYSGIVFYDLILPHLNLGAEKMAGYVNATGRVPLPFSSDYKFFDAQSTPAYEIAWVVQLIGSSLVCILNCGSYGLTSALVAHACGQMRVIGLQLGDLIEGRREKSRNVKQRIAIIVEHHMRVMRYVKYVNESFQMTYLTDELGAFAVICFSGYPVLMTWKDDKFTFRTTIYCILMLSLIFNFFIISNAGQQLWNASEVLGVAANSVQWYRLPPKLARSLISCMTQAARPLKLTAYNMFDMSLVNFSEVLKGAVVFLNLVLTITEFE